MTWGSSMSSARSSQWTGLRYPTADGSRRHHGRRRVPRRELCSHEEGRYFLASATSGLQCWYVPKAVAYHARTTRGLGSKAYMKAIGEFHRQQTEKTDEVRRHAMKNQWLLLLKNEDMYQFIRDAPFIIGRELAVLGHSLVFRPGR